MTAISARVEVSRREFVSAFAVGGVLSLAFQVGCGGSQAQIIRHANATGDLAANAYVTVKRNGRIGLEVDKAEMGQGVTTLYATLVAEELDVAVETIDVHLADSLPDYQTTYGLQVTGGSASTRDNYLPIRRAGAAVREMLIGAAAGELGVTSAACVTENGAVVHRASGRSLRYADLTTKAALQPVPTEPHLKSRSEFKQIGKRRSRVDLRSRVDGSARFGIDVVIPNMLRAYVIHGPVFGAQALRVRAGAARSRAGIVDVFAFDGGVAIVAERFWQARAAAPFVEIEWSAGDVAGLDSAKLAAAARAYKDDGDAVRDDGNANRAIAASPHKFEAVYEAPFLAHAALEPQNCTVRIEADKVEVWAPCQSPTMVQAFVAEVLGVPQSSILVHPTLMGGSFGRRTIPDCAAQAAQIAKRLNRPVQVTWTRESDMTQGFYRPQVAVRMRGGVAADGRVDGLSAQCIGQPIFTNVAPGMRAVMVGIPRALQRVLVEALQGMLATNAFPDPFSTEGLTDTPYAIEQLRVAMSPVHTRLPVGYWRSVGHSVTSFAMESLLDELAHAARLDPIGLRRRMLPPGGRERRVLDAVLALSKWDSPLASGLGRGIARHTSFQTEVAEVAEVEIVDGRIKVRRVYVAVDCGLVVNPDVARSQVEGAVIFGLSAALDQEITLVNGVIQQTSYDKFPVLRMFECPEIIVQFLESDAAPSGIGEPALPPVAPAIANAIFSLTRVRLRRLPLQGAWNEVHR